MRALHLPGVPADGAPPFRFPDKPPSPSDLVYTASDFPDPQPSPSVTSPTYLIRVLATALTRGELTWSEILDPSRFHPHGSAIPGHDVVGIVEKVFPGTSDTNNPPRFSTGDKVWGLLDFDRDGAAATYTIALEDELSLVPAGPSPATGIPEPQAQGDSLLATIPLSGLTAYQALFTHGKLPVSSLFSTPASSSSSNPPHVVVTGASGSVGVPTIQLAKAAGFHVTAVCSGSSRAFVGNTLRADDIIDYTDPQFKSIPDSFTSPSSGPQPRIPVDLVIDCIGGSILKPILASPSSVVQRGGGIVTIVAPIKVIAGEQDPQIQESLQTADVTADFFIVKPSGRELDELGKLLEADRLQPHVDEVFDLEDGGAAMELVESRGRRGAGKIVLRVS